MTTPKLYRRDILEITKKIRTYRTGGLLVLKTPAGQLHGEAMLNARLARAATLSYEILRHEASKREEVVAPAVPAPAIKTADQVGAEREARQQGLRMLRGLNARREGGPVDGLQFQEEQRKAW